MDAVLLKLLNMSFAASWLILAVVLARIVLKKAPKWTRCALWALVAVRLICPFSLESSLSVVPSDGGYAEEWGGRYSGSLTMIPEGNAGYNAAVDGGYGGIIRGDDGVNYVVTGPDGTSKPKTMLDSFMQLWLIGVAAMLIYAAFSYLQLRKRVGASLHLRDNIWLCDEIQTPFILGIFKPRIYLPSGMEDAAAAHVLAHENAHLKRRDHWWKPLGFVLLAVYWFNPLIWLAYILLCRDIELACDEKVIRPMKKPDMLAYSEALLSCSVPRRMVMACPLAFGEVGVKERIKTVLNYRKPAFWIVVVAVVACAVVAVCFLTNPKKNPETPDAERPTLVMNGDSYINPYMPVSEPPYGYVHAGVLSEDQANDTGLSGCEYFIHPDDDDSFFVYQECGTPIDEKTVDSEKLQWAYVRWIKADLEVSYTRLLTLDDVRFMAKKGEALTWSDFDRYTYTETGSGLYIRVYEIDERFSLWIGGGPTDEPPMYLRLVSEANPDEYIDIRTEDVEAFIAEHGSSVTTVGGAGTPDTVTETASDPLDAAVSAAILEHNQNGYKKGDFACESHVKLATVSATPKVGADTHEVIVYAVVLYQEYNIANDGIQEISGSHIPTALSFEVDADGTYTLTEYWEPRDGSYYVPDIREKFPADIAEDALDTQKYILAQKQSCYAQAVEYGKMDTDAIIKTLLDTIISVPAASSNPGDYIDAHPIEYRELTYYGDYTLRYVFGEFLKGGQTGLRGHIMRSVMDDLIGGESLKLEADNGQEYFDAWRGHVERIREQNGDAYMQENYPKGWLLLGQKY